MNEVNKNIDPSEQSFYDCAYFANMDLRYLNNIHSGRIRAIKKILPLIKNKKTLDVGCGGGGFTNIYHTVTKDLLGIDFSPAAIEFAKIWYPHLNVRIVSVFNLSEFFRPGEFEIVIANDVIEHTYDHDEFVQNCKTVLARNGYLIIETELGDTPVSRSIVLRLLRGCLLLLGWDGIKFLMLRVLELPRNRLKNYHDSHVKIISRRELITCLEKHGLSVEHIFIYNATRVLLRDFILDLFRWTTRLETRDHQLIVARRI